MKAIFKQLKNQQPQQPCGDAVCGNVPAMLEYIAERVNQTAEQVRERLEAGETVETCFATYRKYN